MPFVAKAYRFARCHSSSSRSSAAFFAGTSSLPAADRGSIRTVSALNRSSTFAACARSTRRAGPPHGRERGEPVVLLLLILLRLFRGRGEGGERQEKKHGQPPATRAHAAPPGVRHCNSTTLTDCTASHFSPTGGNLSPAFHPHTRITRRRLCQWRSASASTPGSGRRPSPPTTRGWP